MSNNDSNATTTTTATNGRTLPLATAARTLAATPELASFDWIILNSSAGKDSMAMLAATVAECDRQGVDRARLVVAHCDLGRMEWTGTLELAAAQAERFGLRFEVVSRDRDLLEQVLDRHASLTRRNKVAAPWPSKTTQYCTSDQKTSQVHKLMTRLGRESKAAGLTRAVRILSCLGLRAAESSSRSKRAAFEVEKKPTGKGTRKQVWRWLPIFTWTVADVWAEIHASPIADLIHRAYTEHKMPRLSCVFCIFASPNGLMASGAANPELLNEYIAVEEATGYTFRSGLSLASIRDRLAAGEVAGPITTWEDY